MKRMLRRCLAATLMMIAAAVHAGDVSAPTAVANPSPGAPDLTQILTNMEYLRGFRGTGFNFTTDVISMEDGKTSAENQLDVKISEAGDALIDVLTPDIERGRRTLLNGHDIWLYLPGSSNVIRIAPLQRIFGFASIADVLNVSYLTGYTVESSHFAESGLLQLQLKSKDEQATYARIDLDYDVANNRPVETRHYTASGRLLKIIQYKDFRSFDGSPKVEKIAIFDALRKSSVIWMKMSEYHKVNYPPSLFTKYALSETFK